MKKLLISLFAIVTLVACTSAETPVVEGTETPVVTEVTEVETIDTTLNIIAPMGAPALSMIGASLNENNNVEFVNGADLLKAAFISPVSDYDVIVAPSNLGAALISSGASNYGMVAVVTWGNLYVIGNSADVLNDTNAEVALFGEGTVVDLVYKDVLSQNVKAHTTMYGSVQDVQAALLSGDADAALIAEPAATATIVKAKEAGIDLTVVSDLQQLWKDKYNQEGYPQAAIFVSKNSFDNKYDAIEKFLNEVDTTLTTYADTANSTLTADLDVVGTDILGVPSSALVTKVWPKLNLRYIKVEDCTEELDSFMSLFGIEDTSTYTLIK